MLETLKPRNSFNTEAAEQEVDSLFECIEFDMVTPAASISLLKASIGLMIASGSLSYDDLAEVMDGKNFAAIASRESAKTQIIDLVRRALNDLELRLPRLKFDYDLAVLIQGDEAIIMNAIVDVSEMVSSSCSPTCTLLLSTAASAGNARVDVFALGFVDRLIDL